jgi:hypothetical protein
MKGVHLVHSDPTDQGAVVPGGLLNRIHYRSGFAVREGHYDLSSRRDQIKN